MSETFSRSAEARLAVDIGGTFTDLALDWRGDLFTTKVLTTVRAPEEGVLTGVGQVMALAGIGPADLGVVVHGTTLATNALIERKGARTAFLTTAGFRDVLETGHEKRFEQYDVFMDKPPPLVPRHLRFPVPERIAADGEVLEPLDEGVVSRLASKLKALKIESVTVGCINSYVNPAHEIRIRELLLQHSPELWVTTSAEVSPEIREYDRFSTACANAYVQPLMAGYLNRLSERLAAAEIECPLFLMMSGGGLTTLETATRLPIRLVESGPAGGAILASDLARHVGLDEVLSFDMGGTTAKICLIADGSPQRGRVFEVARMYRDLKGSGLPVRIPVIEMVEIGAGGGSIARVDSMQRITVGPDSAGADPGPACYGRGGRQSTVTDANLTLGRLDPARFAGGKVKLDPAAAEAMLTNDVGVALDLSPEWAAAGVSEIVEENMANAARVHAIERGKVIARHTMIAFGGAAPAHAARVADKLGIRTVLVPTGAGVGSAIGFLRAPISYQVVRSHHVALEDIDIGQVNELIDKMRREATAVVRDGAGMATLTESCQVDMRYVGQGHELVVDLPARALRPDDLRALRDAFESLYRNSYGVTVPTQAVEVLTWSMTVIATMPSNASGEAKTVEDLAATAVGQRLLFDAKLGKTADAPLYQRADLVPGARIQGPAVIAEDETTTVVLPAWTARVDGHGHIVMTNNGGN